ncbi:hypothetical protein NEOC65_001572 [Neochlamydia sp. AcF65]|nr:hypothetical protein [Neochlamydia sp. AcF65]MBS4169865.1 hypothetical protein [Neochlamydia sp. AcF95]
MCSFNPLQSYEFLLAVPAVLAASSLQDMTLLFNAK